jgi:transcriptional regulator with XRE-family HTH domain
MLAIILRMPSEVQQDIAGRFKDRRLALNLTQRDLAARSGVSWGSLKRFEREGLISLESLLKIALVLGCLGDFDKLMVDTQDIPAGRTLDNILAKRAERRRATGKKAQIT